MTPQRRTKKYSRKLHPSGNTGPANSYTVHIASRCSQPVGGTGKRWLAEGVNSLAPQYCRPGWPAVANHLIRHDAHNQESRRRVAFDERNRVPEWPWPISKSRTGIVTTTTTTLPVSSLRTKDRVHGLRPLSGEREIAPVLDNWKGAHRSVLKIV